MAVSLESWLNSESLSATKHLPPPAGYLTLSRVGKGVRVALRRLAFGEYRAILAEQKADGDAFEKIARVLPKCVCKADGSPWDGPDLTETLTPAECGSVVAECLKANAVDVTDAKKESSPTP